MAAKGSTVRRLEDHMLGASVPRILPDCVVTLVSAKWLGSDCVEGTYKEPSGKPNNDCVYRYSQASVELVEQVWP